MRLQHLCDIELAYLGEEDEQLTVVMPFGTEGIAYGKGDGTVKGERLQGKILWYNFPRVRGDGVFLPDARGVIDTDDGARILFSMQGYSAPIGADEEREVLTSLTFATEDERYLWLNTAFAVTEAAFDNVRHVSRVRAYVCINELVKKP
jgi:hypothetical protein